MWSSYGKQAGSPSFSGLSFNICVYSKAKCHHADFVHKSTMFNEDGLRTMVNERQARELRMAWQKEEGNEKTAANRTRVSTLQTYSQSFI